MKDRLISEISVYLEKKSEKKVSDFGGFRILRAMETYFAEQRERKKQQEKKRRNPIGSADNVKNHRNAFESHQGEKS